MQKKNVILILIVIFSSQIKAQKSGNEIKGLNNYVDFINEVSHTLSLVYTELEDYNQQFISFNKGKKRNIVYLNKNVKDIRSSFFIPVGRLQKKAIRTTSNLSEKEKLKELSGKITNRINSIILHRDTLINYTRNRLYKNDDNMETAHSIMSKIEILFSEITKYKAETEVIINKAGAKYKYSRQNNEISKLIDRINPLMDKCNRILELIRNKNMPGYKEIHNELFSEISMLIDKKALYLSDFQDDYKNGLSPSSLYDNLIASAVKFYETSQNYLKHTNVKNEKGREYVFYNEKFLKDFNRYGGGIISFYNKLTEQSEIALLRKSEKLNWFEVYPKKEKSEGNQALKEYHKRNVALGEVPEIPIRTEPKEKIAEGPDPNSLKGFAANNLVLLLDVSASMNKPEKLPILKSALKHLLTLMRPEDYVSIVVYSGKAKIVLKPTSSDNIKKIEKVIDKLKSGGGTNVLKGMKLSYKVAKDNFIVNGNNRVIMASDGGFNMSRSIYNKAEQFADNKINFSVFYLNKKETTDFSEKFKKLAEKGNGNYFYITEKNAQNALLKEAQSLLK